MFGLEGTGTTTPLVSSVAAGDMMGMESEDRCVYQALKRPAGWEREGGKLRVATVLAGS